MEKNIKDVNFRAYPGKVNNMVYEFPPLYVKDSKQKMRVWSIVVRIVDKSAVKKYGINWEDPPNLTLHPIADSYLDVDDLPPNSVAQIYVETGQVGGKLSRHEPTFVMTGSYQGTTRKDRQTAFTQALIKARSLYNKKIDQGFQTSAEDATNYVGRLLPMALHRYDDNIAKVKYPVYMQKKYDGIRCLAYSTKVDIDPNVGVKVDKVKNAKVNVIMYSRHNIDFTGLDHIRNDLSTMYTKFNDHLNEFNIDGSKPIYIDGEFYKHGMGLQQISGMARREEASELYFVIFDVIYYLNGQSVPTSPFSDRLKVLNKLCINLKNIECAETVLCNNVNEVNKFYKQALDSGYEGAILRMQDSLYEISMTKEKRSYTTLKLKPSFDDEYEIIGFNQGTKGKDVGALIWVLRTKDGKQFTSVPKDMTYDTRYQIFKDLTLHPDKFKKEYLGKMMTIEFQDLSEDGVPQRAKAKAIRNEAD